MKLIHKRKATTAASLKQTLKQLPDDEIWVYGEGKLSNEEYHNSPHSISSSVLKQVIDPNVSDYHVYRHHVKKDIERETKAFFDVGASAHMKVLEPHVFDDLVRVQPEEIKMRRGKAWDAFSAENEGKTIITKDQYDQVCAMANLINKNKHAKMLLDACHKEVSGYRKHETGVILRARADAISFSHGFVADLKFMDDISPAGFAKAAANNGYYIQQWVYKYVFNVEEFYFICVGKKEPSQVAIYMLNEDYEAKAAEQVPPALAHWKNCTENNRWNSFTTEDEPVKVLAAPNWFNYV